MQDDKHFYTVEEAARRLRVHTSTVYRALDRGELRGLKIGRQ